MVPRSIFMPHTKASSPFSGVNSIATGWFSGRSRVICNDGNVTWAAQVLSVVRTNVRTAGTPARSDNRAGSTPCSPTVTRAPWDFGRGSVSPDPEFVAAADKVVATPRRSRSARIGLIAVVGLVLANGLFVATEFPSWRRADLASQLGEEGRACAAAAKAVVRHLDA
jgi:hypothetical protein